MRKWRIKEYGLTVEEYEAKLAAQDDICGACGLPAEPGDPLVLDHNHRTSVNRAFIHQTCNKMIGLAGDDPIVLLRAAVYLLKHEESDRHV